MIQSLFKKDYPLRKNTRKIKITRAPMRHTGPVTLWVGADHGSERDSVLLLLLQQVNTHTHEWTHTHKRQKKN